MEKWSCRGVPARKLEPPAAYRLRADIERWVKKFQEGSLGGEILNGPLTLTR
jgi:hypothetical protein